MRLYKDVDYYIYFEDLKHMGVAGAIMANSDGTANIYINTLYDIPRREQALRHELRHLAKNHLYNDTLTLYEKEADADRVNADDCTFGPGYTWVEYRPRMIPLFRSLDALGRFTKKVMEG